MGRTEGRGRWLSLRPSANEPNLIRGVATAGLELLEDPSPDILLCPVGGGSSVSGYCLIVGEATDCNVVGIQSADADAMTRAGEASDLDPQESAETFAEGLQSRVPFALTSRILRDRLADMRTVGDDAIREAIRFALERENLLLEGTGAEQTRRRLPAIAGAREMSGEIAGEAIVVVLSGQNLSTGKLRRLLGE